MPHSAPRAPNASEGDGLRAESPPEEPPPPPPPCPAPPGERSGIRGPPAQQSCLPRNTVRTSSRSGADEMRPRWAPSPQHFTHPVSLQVCQLGPPGPAGRVPRAGTVSASEAEPALARSTRAGTKNSLQRFGSRPSQDTGAMISSKTMMRTEGPPVIPNRRPSGVPSAELSSQAPPVCKEHRAGPAGSRGYWV